VIDAGAWCLGDRDRFVAAEIATGRADGMPLMAARPLIFGTVTDAVETVCGALARQRAAPDGRDGFGLGRATARCLVARPPSTGFSAKDRGDMRATGCCGTWLEGIWFCGSGPADRGPIPYSSCYDRAENAVIGFGTLARETAWCNARFRGWVTAVACGKVTGIVKRLQLHAAWRGLRRRQIPPNQGVAAAMPALLFELGGHRPVP